MGFCNARTLSMMVAGLIIAVCLMVVVLDLILMGMFFMDRSFQHSRDYDSIKEVAVPYFVIVFMFFMAGFVTAILFIVGVKKNRPGQMAPFVFLSAACIILAGVSTLCVFIANLVKEPTFAHAALQFIESSICIGLLILLFSPMFLLYRRMSIVQPEQETLRTHLLLQKPTYTELAQNTYGSEM